jgi:hypothetical protein
MRATKLHEIVVTAPVLAAMQYRMDDYEAKQPS